MSQKPLSKFQCPFCEAVFNVMPSFNSQEEIKCPNCKGTFTFNDANLANISRCCMFFKLVTWIMIWLFIIMSIIVFITKLVVVGLIDTQRSRELQPQINVTAVQAEKTVKEVRQTVEETSTSRQSKYKKDGENLIK